MAVITDEAGSAILDEAGADLYDELGAPPAEAPQGSWWGLHSVFKQSQQEFDAYWSRPPAACPVCGEPLSPPPDTPRGSTIELYCRNAGDHEFHYPRDYVRPTRLGGGFW